MDQSDLVQGVDGLEIARLPVVRLPPHRPEPGGAPAHLDPHGARRPEVSVAPVDAVLGPRRFGVIRPGRH